MAKATRKSTPRVKTGCRTCRIRRVKCDEMKPSCQRCTQTGRKCDGYVEQKSGALTLSSTLSYGSSPDLLEAMAYSIPFRMPGSQRDRQLLHYFCVRGATELSGFVNNEFWSRTALLACQNETIVRQSLIALSSLHLDLSRSGVTGAEAIGNDTLVQYGKALRSLQARINRPDQTPQARFETSKTALICCALFYCFESAMGDSQAAMNHLGNGLQLLASHNEGQTAEDEEMASLRDIFGRLDLQATFFDDGRTPAIAMVSPTERKVGLVPYPESTFSGLADAQKHLNRLQNWLLHFILENLQYQGKPRNLIPDAVLAEKDRLTAGLGHWAQIFSNLAGASPLFAGKASIDSYLCRSTKTLHVQHAMSSMLLASKIPDRPDIFGAVPNLEAQRIVQQCQNILLPEGGRGAPLSAAPESAISPGNLSSETGVIMALFLLAMKCADERVIEEATDLLVMSQRREGLYDARTMATMVQQLKGVRNRRRQGLEDLGLQPGTDIALEDWAGDLIDQAHGGVGVLAAVVAGCE